MTGEMRVMWPQFSFVICQCGPISMPNFPWLFCLILQSLVWKLKKSNMDPSLPFFFFPVLIPFNNPTFLWGNIDGTDGLKIWRKENKNNLYFKIISHRIGDNLKRLHSRSQSRIDSFTLACLVFCCC